MPSRTFVLAVGGSFNPVHCSHIALLEVAKHALQTIFPDARFVGFLAVASGSHVRGKCGKAQAMKQEHR